MSRLEWKWLSLKEVPTPQDFEQNPRLPFELSIAAAAKILPNSSKPGNGETQREGPVHLATSSHARGAFGLQEACAGPWASGPRTRQQQGGMP